MLAKKPKAEREAILKSLTPEEAKALQYEWRFWARPKQLPPLGDWIVWLILAGRGFGKTRTGAEWVIEQVRSHGARRVALVAETAADARDVMVKGESGIVACSPPWFYPKYEPSKRLLTWPNGAIATTYSAEKPDQLRGPQHDCFWGDEVAKWRYADAWDQLMFGLRLGNNPRGIATTTPRPTPLIKELVKDSKTALTKGSTFENAANLARQFLHAIVQKYEGTRLGRQELNAEMLDDAPGALWSREAIESCRVQKTPHLVRIVVAVDPSVSAESETAETGIVVAGLGEDGHGYILGDFSVEQPTPEQWGKAAVTAYHMHKADRVIGEVNNGGDLVESNVRAIERNIPFRQVRASRGKAVRAEPVSSFYEQGRIHHVGMFSKLEDQMCEWEPGISTWSPNRVDALVWGITELMVKPKGSGGAAFFSVGD